VSALPPLLITDSKEGRLTLSAEDLRLLRRLQVSGLYRSNVDPRIQK
jgi:hypothetical protein